MIRNHLPAICLVLTTCIASTQENASNPLAVGGSFVYADLGRAKISNPTTLEGDYDTNRALFLALNVNWKF